MRIEILKCDLCNREIKPGESKVVLPAVTNRKAQISAPLVLTPRGDRLHAGQPGKRCMIRMNASLYCGTSDEELHFHKGCIFAEAIERLTKYWAQTGRHIA